MIVIVISFLIVIAFFVLLLFWVEGKFHDNDDD